MRRKGSNNGWLSLDLLYFDASPEEISKLQGKSTVIKNSKSQDAVSDDIVAMDEVASFNNHVFANITNTSSKDSCDMSEFDNEPREPEACMCCMIDACDDLDLTGVDVVEDRLELLSPKLLKILLTDQTKTHIQGGRQYIFWASNDYEEIGKGYQYNDPIIPQLITGENSHIILPRTLKHKDTQSLRSRGMAEVCTPAWICNEQLNLIDAQWFGRENVFNVPSRDAEGNHIWNSTNDNGVKIAFPEGKTWQDYIKDTRLEVSCGEAPYIVSRYDAVSGKLINISDRIGILDRKFRVLDENTSSKKDWFEWSKIAYQSVYAYEWQGDSLLLARESLMVSFIDYFTVKFGEIPPVKWMEEIAEIISWNVWQMDGMKGVIPNSCINNLSNEVSFLGRIGSTGLFGLDFGDDAITVEAQKCQGCAKNDMLGHNGTYCLIRDWFAPSQSGSSGDKTPETDQFQDEPVLIKFVDLM